MIKTDDEKDSTLQTLLAAMTVGVPDDEVKLTQEGGPAATVKESALVPSQPIFVLTPS